MYVLARDIHIGNVTISKGTRLSDLYDGAPDNKWYAIAYPSVGGRIKITLYRDEFKFVEANS